MSRFGMILKPYKKPNGYYQITLCKNGKRKKFTVHRLYSKAFIPNEDNKPFIDHINRIRTDNRLENLRWATRSENSRNVKKWGTIWTTKYNTYKAQWLPIPTKQKAKCFKTYEEAKAFLDAKRYDENGYEITI